MPLWKCDKSQFLESSNINSGGGGGGNYTFQKQLFFTMLKKPKILGRGLKSWGIVENGLYFENIKKKNPKN